MRSVSDRMPVTLEAAEKLPTRSGRSAWRRSSSSWPRSTWPAASSPMATTSAADSRQGSRLEWCSKGPRTPPGAVRPRQGPELQQADQLGHRRRRARPAEDDQVLVGAADGLVDHLAGLLAQPGGVAAGARALGVGVGVPGQDLAADGVLDEPQRPARGGPVGIGHAPGAERPGQHLVAADDPAADPLHQRRRRSRRAAGGLRPSTEPRTRSVTVTAASSPVSRWYPVAAAPGPSATR